MEDPRGKELMSRSDWGERGVKGEKGKRSKKNLSAIRHPEKVLSFCDAWRRDLGSFKDLIYKKQGGKKGRKY